MIDPWTDRLSEWLDGNLSPGEEEELVQHLQNCPQCRETAERLRSVIAILRQHSAEEASALTWQNVRRHIAPQKPWRTLTRIAAALVLLMASAVSILLFHAINDHESEAIPPPIPVSFLTHPAEISDLEAATREAKRRMDPESARQTEAMLEGIDMAMSDVEQFLESDQTNPFLIRYREHLRSQKLHALRAIVASSEQRTR